MFDVSFKPVQASSLLQSTARDGFGQETLQSMLMSQMNPIRQQFNSSKQQALGSLGKRGLANSSIMGDTIAGLLANRQSQGLNVRTNLNNQNNQVMLNAQNALSRLNQFNARGQFDANVHNQNMAFQQQQLEEQQRMSRWRMAVGLAGLAAAPFTGGLSMGAAGAVNSGIGG